MILAMGIISGLDVNPDEWNGHVKAAAYYIENWLPPAVDDPRIVSSISVFGVSYLWHIDPYYFIAVKATQVLSGIVSDFYLRVRLANAFLFLSLVLVFAVQIKRSKWMVPFIVISPQVWYVFSYFNNDAFPLFIAMILAIAGRRFGIFAEPLPCESHHGSARPGRDSDGHIDRPSPILKIELSDIHRFSDLCRVYGESCLRHRFRRESFK